MIGRRAEPLASSGLVRIWIKYLYHVVMVYLCLWHLTRAYFHLLRLGKQHISGEFTNSSNCDPSLMAHESHVSSSGKGDFIWLLGGAIAT